MTRCRSCNREGSDRIHLVHDPTGDQMDVCPRCLRASALMKADGRDARGHRTLEEYAEKTGYQMWRSPDVQCLLPPEQEPSLTKAEAEPAAPAHRTMMRHA